jgi:hypothetical protein
LEEYIQEITALKDKYARGPAKKMLAGIMEVYPRPTFKGNISKFLIKSSEDIAVEALLELGLEK